MQKRRGGRDSAGAPSPHAFRALRPWLRFRTGKRGDFDRYLVESAMQRRETAGVRRRSPIAKSIAVGLLLLAAAALAIWSW